MVHCVPRIKKQNSVLQDTMHACFETCGAIISKKSMDGRESRLSGTLAADKGYERRKSVLEAKVLERWYFGGHWVQCFTT